ncbi:voltage-gated potassium channel [Aureococcus anophagefferens]|nr:voltage-gated potassium channel [Aureococcus anophagefferens]
MAYKGAALWQADGRTVTKKFSAADGSELAEFQMTDIADPNHVQLVEEDKYAFVSSRQTDGIVRVHVATGDVVYTIGGEYGDFEIFDAAGRKWKKGTSLWVGQHNAEYFGDDEFCLFDNQEASASSTLNASRLLCLRLDEAEGTATVTFEKVLDSYTPHFGDNDRLPSGNQLGVSWPKTFSTDDQYDVRAIEVVRSSAASGAARFDAVNNFKQNNVAPATYAVSAAAGTDKPYATGDFDFKVHWRQTPVAVDSALARPRARSSSP